jgi:L-malate glycosyltransferase
MSSIGRPSRILYLIDYFSGPRGGTERQLFQLIKSLDRGRFEPTLGVFRPTAYLQHEQLPCDTIVLGIHPLARPLALMRLFGLSRYIRTTGTRLVHTFFNDSALAAPFFCKLAGARVVASRRDMGFWYTPSTLAALKFSNLFVDRIVANSEAVRENVSRRERFPKNRVVVIRNGHDESKFSALPARDFRKEWQLGEEDPLIGIVANVSPIKRHQDLLEALTIIHARHPSAVVILVGGGGNMEMALTRDLARKLKIENHVRFLGSVEDPIPVIKHCDVCVLCSESEGLSNAIIQYMGCGKATVCTDSGGNGELVKNGHSGFLVPVGDPKKLADRVLRILEDPALRRRLEVNARADVLGGAFSLETMVDSHLSLYSGLLTGPTHRVEP